MKTKSNIKKVKKLRGKSPVSSAAKECKAIHPAKILVAVDFSGESEKAVKYAAALARRFGSELVLAHVIEPVSYPSDFGYGPMILEFPGKDAERKIQLKLSALGKECAGGKVPVSIEILNGPAYHEIVRAAKALEINLIVIGTHGYTGLNHALIGSTAEKVVRHAPCPVLVVRKKERDLV